MSEKRKELQHNGFFYLIPDCITEINERESPAYAYTSPSFKLPMYSCLIILVLGALLHLGLNAVTRAAEGESKERESLALRLRNLLTRLLKVLIDLKDI